MDAMSLQSRTCVAAVIATGLLIVPVVAVAQSAGADTVWAVPRMADGQPDLQGVWANNSVTPLERPEAWVGKPQLTEEELANLQTAAAQVTTSGLDAVFGDQLVQAAIAGIEDADSYDTTGNYNQFWLADRTFDDRTSLIIDPRDGRMPALIPRAQRKADARRTYRREHPADSWEDRGLGERCVHFGVPKLGAGYNSYSQIVQTPDHFVIYHEMAHDVRVIPLDGRPHLPPGIRQWMGSARAHWEGETLVVESVNFSPKANFRGSNTNLHLIERFARVSPTTLDYEVTVTDPTIWTRSWTASIPLQKSDDAVYEYACHEGNYGMEGILAGHRAQEAAEVATGEVP